MTSKKLYYILLGCIGLAFVGLLAGTYGINVLMTANSTSLTNLKATAQANVIEQQTLQKSKKELQTYGSLNQIAQAIVPQDKNQVETVREIVDIAAQNGVNLASITFPASTLGTSSVAGSAASSTSTSTATNLSSLENSKTSALSQLTPVKSIPNVYQLQITIQGDSNKPTPYPNFINFLTALQQNSRTAQISSVVMTPNSASPNLISFTINLNEYIKP